MTTFIALCSRGFGGQSVVGEARFQMRVADFCSAGCRSNPAGIASHDFDLLDFNGLRLFLANWFVGLPIPVPEMIFSPALSASLMRFASSIYRWASPIVFQPNHAINSGAVAPLSAWRTAAALRSP
ncbi:hypothetical protein [Bradyrhizobium sp. CCBAU 53421]|uniref:hypothetical protein n=1 Tax=Bradyrhizobium sp. CCBAU 53421 TaxID=1325120 RepID=UPI00188C002A|nr:hypothetical protein [Bradyrhizobium sp. CCBAU 53421]